MKHTQEWPLWDGSVSLQDKRIRLEYRTGGAYAVGVAEKVGVGRYRIVGTNIGFTNASRVRVAPEGEK